MAKIKDLFKKIKKLSKKKKIILVISVFILIAITCVYFLLILKGDPLKFRKKEQFIPDQVVTYSTDKPSEKNVKDFQVPADMPKRIILKSVGREGYIQTLGIDQNGDIAVPNNVLMAGWYINSKRPGEQGLSIITGHRDGILKKGIFRELGKLKKNDKVEIEYGDSSMRSFKVVDVKQTSIKDTYDLMYEKRESIEKQLNLVTCGGTYSKESQTYNERIVVVLEGI